MATLWCRDLAALGRDSKMPRVSSIEFGVFGGSVMERCVAEVAEVVYRVEAVQKLVRLLRWRWVSLLGYVLEAARGANRL